MTTPKRRSLLSFIFTCLWKTSDIKIVVRDKWHRLAFRVEWELRMLIKISVRVLRLRSADWTSSLNYRVPSLCMMLFSLCSTTVLATNLLFQKIPVIRLKPFNIMLSNWCCQNPHAPNNNSFWLARNSRLVGFQSTTLILQFLI